VIIPPYLGEYRASTSGKLLGALAVSASFSSAVSMATAAAEDPLLSRWPEDALISKRGEGRERDLRINGEQ